MTRVDCVLPDCEWFLIIPDTSGDNPHQSAAVADAMGVPRDGFEAIRRHQAQQRAERDIERHVDSHPRSAYVLEIARLRSLQRVETAR